MKKILTIIIGLSVTFLSFAQISVRGTVVDDSDTPIPGAVVMERGTGNGTVADGDGAWTLKVSGPDAVMEVSCIGYESATVNVGKQSVFKVTLPVSANLLEETVVVGYGTMRKKDLTGSVGTLKGDAIENKVVLSVDDALAGGVAGLMVSSASGKPGSSSTMLVRGANSLTGSTSPLVVVDGIPLFDVSTSTGGGLDYYDVGMSTLSMVNPDDIASIDVLKDASATAIYGNRGANGVILITTKKGNEAGGKIQYSNYFGAQIMNRRYDVMDFQQYAAYQAERNSSNTLFYDSSAGGARKIGDVKSIDWQYEIFRTGFVQNHSLSISHATKKTNFLLSGSFMQDKSIIINTDWRKYTAKASVDHYFTDHIRMGASVRFSRITDDGVPTGGGADEGGGRVSGIITTALTRIPYDIRDADTQALFRRAGVSQTTLDNLVNDYRGDPVIQAQDTQLSKIINRTMLNGYFEADIIQDLVLKITGGADIYSLKDRQYYPTTTARGWFYKGQGIIGSSESTSWINENTLTWRPTFGKHRLNVLGGASIQHNVSYMDQTTSEQYTYEGLGYNSVGKALVYNQISSKGTVNYLSFMFRANYSYDNRYIATFTARRDGTSRFVKNKWGNFFSGALAWNIDQEEFMKKQNVVSTLKLRLSAGQVGNSNVPTTGSYAQLTDANHSFGGNEQVGQVAASIANENLTWETTTEYNVGLETGFFNNRLTFNADFYYKLTDNLILNAPVVNVSGFKTAWQNIGKMSNKGFELTLGALIINTKDFKWNFNANFSLNRTEILELGQNGAPIYLEARVSGDNAFILQEHGSVGEIYGYKVQGVYGVNDFESDGVTPKKGVAVKTGSERPGYQKLVDVNGDGQITPEDRVVIGNSLPDFFGGFNTTFTWKNFDLYANFIYSVGADVYNANYDLIARYSGTTSNQSAMWQERWTLNNRTSTMYTNKNLKEVNSAFVEDASFLRCKTLRLSYTFNKFSPKTHIGSLKLFISADNLFVVTNYSGYDPEVSSNQGTTTAAGILTSGFDYGCFPRPQTFTGGLNITFR